MNVKRSNRKSTRVANPCGVAVEINPFLLQRDEAGNSTVPVSAAPTDTSDLHEQR